MSDPLKDCKESDGSLYNLSWYLSWKTGSNEAVLDGEFTANDLIAIAEHMKGTIMTTKIIPITNGRVVYFVPHNYPGVTQFIKTIPLTAHVCHVWDNHLVNLDVIDSNGAHHAITSVQFIQPGEEKPDDRHFAHWMDYQVGQAAKYEAEAAKNAPTAPIS